MEDDAAPGEADEQYGAAYAAHYTTKNLHTALELYLRVLTSYPNSPEAAYSREQIHNIVRSVIPRQEILDALVALARKRLKHVWKAPASVARLASQRPGLRKAAQSSKQAIR